MKILVTGGAGFIGKHVVQFLLEKGNTITILDNFSNSNKKSLVFLVEKGVKIIEGDITKLEDTDNAIKNHQIVIHLAAKISVKDSIKNPLETFEINVEGTKNIIASCKKYHVEKLIIASSAEIYGENDLKIKVNEKIKNNPISPYGESKLKMEEEIKENLSKTNTKYVILRFFNIYGIGQSHEYAGVITKFLERIKNNEFLEIFGDGMQTRNFISIKDVIDSIYKSIEYNKNGTFNIGSEEGITIKKLAELMISLSGKKLEIHYVPFKKGDIQYSNANIELAKKCLKYNPKIDLKDEINEMLKN